MCDTDSVFYLNVWFESEAIADSRRDECNRMVMNMLCSICFFRNLLELLTLCGSIVPGAPKHYSGD